uniref:Uncharacterized protein n=1 Tax=Rhizophora mucronata TaxID=61149 RepID=A0A2P2NKL0_RHIMU
MGRYLQIERLVNPCLPTPTSLLSNRWSGSCTIFQLLRLWLLAKHEIACPK